MAFTAQDVKNLRESTGAGMMDCKKALQETAGDFEKAVVWLREKGMAKAAKRADRTASEGAIVAYIHPGARYGVLAEVNCETDFVARGEEFQALCKDICHQICSKAPRWIRREDVPQEAIEAEKQVYMAQAKEMGKPEKILGKIADGMMTKWFKEVCLLEQEFVKDNETTIENFLKALSGKVGEKIEIRRFARFQLGEGIEKKESNLAAEVAQAIADARASVDAERK